jgi:hypothetical protein
MTLVALVELTRTQGAVLGAAALWAHKTGWPAPPEQRRGTLLLSSDERLPE